MKVVHATSVHPRYDIRIFMKECRTLAESGFDVTLVVADGKGDETVDGVRIVDAGGNIAGRLSRILGAARRVIETAHRLDPDLVQFHDPELIPGALGLTRRGIKVIYDVHEDVPRQIQGKHWIPRPLKKPVSWSVEVMEDFAVRRFTAIVAATPLLRDRFLPNNRNAVDVCNFPILAEFSRSIPWESRSSEACYVGDLSRIRGIGPLVAALPIAGVRLNLAGRWLDDGLRESVTASDGWQFVNELGFLDRSGVTNVLARSRVGIVTLFANPNDIDSLPIKMFEYMAAGIPVVASDFPLWREIINNAGCGLLVEPHDSSAIANAIHWLLDHDSDARAMGEAGRRAVLDRYNWANEAGKLADLYGRLT